MPLKNSCSIHARWPKAVWSIPYVSVAFFPSLKQNFIAYRSSKVSSRSDCIFEIHQLWQSGFSRVYSNSCCSCSFEIEIIKNCQSSHETYSNNILNFQESASILNACTKKVWKLIECTTYLSFKLIVGMLVYLSAPDFLFNVCRLWPPLPWIKKKMGSYTIWVDRNDIC